MNEDKFSISKDLLRLMCFILPQFKPRYISDLHRELNPNQIEETIVWDAFASISGDDRFLFYAFLIRRNLFLKKKNYFLEKMVFSPENWRTQFFLKK